MTLHLARLVAVLSLASAAPALAAARPQKAERPAPVRDAADLAAPWQTVELVSQGKTLLEGHMGGPTGWYDIVHPAFLKIEAGLADFLRFNQRASLTPYEASAIAHGISRGDNVPRLWNSDQLRTADGRYTIGDRVNFKTHWGDTTGIVVAAKGNKIQILTADQRRTFDIYEIARHQITKKVTLAYLDGAPLAR